MKKFSVLLLLAVLTFGVVVQPTDTYAKSSNSGSSYHDDDEDEEDDDGDHRGHDDDEDEDEDDRDDDEDDNSATSTIEAEADVFTDTTIIKVELENGRKVRFMSNADTRDEVLDAIVNRLGLNRAEVDDVLDYEVEDRASRAKDRKGLNGTTNNQSDDDSTCTATSNVLRIEADVFTDTTIVKVERNGSTTIVFETDATTTDAVVDVVEARLNLSESDIRAALDLDVEDRASRAKEFVIRTGNDDCDDDSTDTVSSNNRDLQAKIAQLQALLQTLIRLFNQQFGTAN